MKKLMLLVGMLLFVSNLASAQLDPDYNGLSVFFDAQTPVRCQMVPTGLKTVYLVATNLSQVAGLSGWEGRVYCDNPAWMFLSATVHGNGPINILTPPDFMVGLYSPMESRPFMLLVSLQFFVQNLAPTPFRVGQCSSPSTPGAPCYADGVDPGILVRFVSPAADWSLPVAWANSPDCNIVQIQDETWGGVKGMFK